MPLSLKSKLFFSGLLFISLFLLTAQFALPALALDPNNVINPWGTDDIKSNVQENVGLGEKDPRSLAASVISVALGFLGIIAVGLILFAGFKWMTAGGNEDKVSDAKKILAAGVIGLAIILAAWAIATFVLSLLIDATTE